MNYRPRIPRYLQIADALRRDLRGEGERIASEHQLCARFGVSRPTPSTRSCWFMGVERLRKGPPLSMSGDLNIPLQ